MKPVIERDGNSETFVCGDKRRKDLREIMEKELARVHNR